MHYITPDQIFNLKHFKNLIPIGNKCLSRIALERAGLAGQSFPFDFVPTQPHLILKYLQNRTDFLPVDPMLPHNSDRVWFGHFDLSQAARRNLEKKMERRFLRLEQVFQNRHKFMLIYTTEADVYNEMSSQINSELNYLNLKKLVAYIQGCYPKADFDLLAIHTNIQHAHESIGRTTIYNYSVYVEPEHISMDNSTSVPETILPYREMVTQFVRQIFVGRRAFFVKKASTLTRNVLRRRSSFTFHESR